jgi:HEAT repeat protein
MKKLSAIFFLLVFAGSLFASAKTTNDSNVEDNLIVGLKSDNLGLKTSSAYMLGEYGTSKSINSLLKVLKSGDTEEERISAAMALVKINTEQSMFAVKQNAKFDDSERVRKLCALFYNQSLQNN